MIRQLTVAVADCGSAFSAWPPLSIVATQVVRSCGDMVRDRRSSRSMRRSRRSRPGRRRPDHRPADRSRVGALRRSWRGSPRCSRRGSGRPPAAAARPQRVDGVVGARHRRVAAGVGGGEREGGVDLLGGLRAERRRGRSRLAPRRRRRCSARTRPRAARGTCASSHCMPCSAVALLVAGQHHDRLARRHESVALPAHHVGDQHRRAGLVVEARRGR